MYFVTFFFFKRIAFAKYLLVLDLATSGFLRTGLCFLSIKELFGLRCSRWPWGPWGNIPLVYLIIIITSNQPASILLQFHFHSSIDWATGWPPTYTLVKYFLIQVSLLFVLIYIYIYYLRMLQLWFSIIFFNLIVLSWDTFLVCGAEGPHDIYYNKLPEQVKWRLLFHAYLPHSMSHWPKRVPGKNLFHIKGIFRFWGRAVTTCFHIQQQL